MCCKRIVTDFRMQAQEIMSERSMDSLCSTIGEGNRNKQASIQQQKEPENKNRARGTPPDIPRSNSPIMSPTSCSSPAQRHGVYLDGVQFAKTPGNLGYIQDGVCARENCWPMPLLQYLELTDLTSRIAGLGLTRRPNFGGQKLAFGIGATPPPAKRTTTTN